MNIKDCFKNHTIDELKKIYRDNAKEPIIICLNPDMDRNIGAMLRTASGYFFQKMVIIGRRKTDFKSSVGMNHYMPIEYVKATKGIYNEEYDFTEIINYLIDLSKTHCIVIVELDDNSIKLTKMNDAINSTGKPPAFLMGNEKDGVPLEILNCDKFDKIIVEIPSIGLGRSYNVSNSFSMVYWEYIRNKN